MWQIKFLFLSFGFLTWMTGIAAFSPTQPAIASQISQGSNANEENLVTTNTNEVGTRLILKLRERRVYVYQGENLLSDYPVAIGRQGWETPTGNFKVMQMIQNPSWEHPWNGTVIEPGPDNPLGDRWIGFWTDGKNFIGFHGTPGEHLIGQAVSHGCVRMRNRDIQSLFKQVEIGTPVFVEP